MRKKLFSLLEVTDEENKTSLVYDFYDIFKDQLYKDLDRIYYYDDWYNLQRGKDINYVSCLFLNGPIEKGIAPACRALIAPIEMATNTQAYFCGKPNPLMMRTCGGCCTATPATP